jgi:transposase
MPAPYSKDLREKVMFTFDSGMNPTKISRLFNICRSTVYDWIEIRNQRGSLRAKTGFQKGHSHVITDLDKFKKFVDQHPDYTQTELADAWPIKVSVSSIARSLIKIGYSRKKNVMTIKKETKISAINL